MGDRRKVCCKHTFAHAHACAEDLSASVLAGDLSASGLTSGLARTSAA